jgi:hypothetical protein
VTAIPGCSWTPVSSAGDWLYVDVTPRTGSQQVGYSYSPRGPYSQPRAATITIADQTFTLTQPGTAVSFVVYPAAASIGPGAGTLPFLVQPSVVDVPWVTASNDPWLEVSAGTSGSGVVTVTVARSPSTTARAGTVVIAGTTVTVQQAANGPPGEPTNFAVAVSGHVGRFTWGPPLLSNDAPSYRIEAGATPGTTLVTIPVAAVPTEYVMPEVPAGWFFVRLRGVNEYGVGPPTEDVELVVGAGGTSVPVAPGGLFAFLSSGSLQAQWQPGQVPGETVTAYVLEAGRATGRTDVSLPMGLAQFTTITNVPPGAFFLRVRAVNGAGPGRATAEHLIVSGAGPAPPGTPLNLAAGVTGSTVTLRWNPPGNGVRRTATVSRSGRTAARPRSSSKRRWRRRPSASPGCPPAAISCAFAA